MPGNKRECVKKLHAREVCPNLPAAMSLTAAQQQAVTARGNVIVIAGAGTGKTSTLVARCLHCLLAETPRVSLQEILMVTFTEAAAAEMRQRIRAELEKQLAAHPHDLHWHEQLALFDTAHIGTLHGFCLKLARQHFYELQIDPQLAVLPEEEAQLLAQETLETVLQESYAHRSEISEAVQQLIQAGGRGWDRPIRALVLKLHHYTQTLADPEGWFAEQLSLFEAPEPVRWREWLLDAAVNWSACWLPILRELARGNPRAAECARALGNISGQSSRSEIAAVLAEVSGCLAPENFPRGTAGKWRKPLETFLAETAFLMSLAQVKDGKDPLVEDWNWNRAQITTLLRLAREFSTAFASAKREQGAVDFHDLEQFALRLLWDPQAKRPTAIAEEWRNRLRFIFVDEYQDINAAQDKIIEALSREPGNRFLVGDVKQSIYRFRLANPYIFQHYAQTWRGARGQAVALTENFRSREGLLDFVNSVFELLMRPEAGSVVYDADAKLRFGDTGERRPLSRAADPAPRVELALRVKTSGEPAAEAEATEALADIAGLEDAEKEARMIGLRLLELKNQRHMIWDRQKNLLRPVEWGDVAVLLRSPARKAESYAKEFSRLGVPLAVARSGFYASMEIADLLSLLQLLDNPLQDIPAIAVLHSPVVGLGLNELATVRLAGKGHFWMALRRWRESCQVQTSTSPLASGMFEKVDAFLNRFARWRRLARQVSLSRCLDTVLTETHYSEWLLTQSRGEQRRANVQRLLGLAQQFDRFQRQGLFRFLRFIEAQQEAETEPDVAAIVDENAVRLMSIHQSKGLEFPVVVVADLGKRFNDMDQRGEVILDELYGVCARIKPPHTGRRYPSLPYWLARRRQQQEMLGEEMRLLYVAMTRARDTLVLAGSVSEKQFNSRWFGELAVNGNTLLSARSYADWLGLWFGLNVNAAEGETEGETPLLRWSLWNDARLAAPRMETADKNPPAIPSESEDTWDNLRARIAWQYPFPAATKKPAKASVSSLRREAAGQSEDEEAAPVPPIRAQARRIHVRQAAADIGTAHHRFLQHVSFDRLESADALREESNRLEREGILLADETAALNFETLAAFWQSDLGRRIRARSADVKRELNFTARFSPDELAKITGGKPPDERESKFIEEDGSIIEPGPGYHAHGVANEFIVVQGTADLAVLLPEEIWLLDFKTDNLAPLELAARTEVYAPQLKLYARALTKIYRKPVTECRIHFLAPGKTVTIDVNSAARV